MYEDVKTIKELAGLKIEEIFDALGIDSREKYHSLVGPCPVHGGNRKDAFSYHVERGIWKCFSRSCDEKYGSDIFGLVQGVRECTFKQAVSWTKGFVNTNLTDEQVQEIRDSRSNKDFIVAVQRKKSQTKTYSVEVLKKLAWHDYLVEERGYPRGLIESYQIGACLRPGLYMSNRVVIPVINMTGEIVGFTGRTLQKDWKSRGIPKWLHSRGAWIEVNVFNAHRAANFVKESEHVIICEGPLDVLRLEEAGFHNGVAILGKKLHNGQLTTLMNMGATRLTLALDNDTAGKIGMSSAMKTAKCLFDIDILELPEHRNDIGEMTIDELTELSEVLCARS
jgi:5S rRNA maturation endonuclease (ribonuclease M5)